MRCKALSRQKIEANRRNALKSTGPKTLRGKNYSRMNALKYGLFAKDLFAYFMVKKENPEEFHELVTQLCDQHKPIGKAEELEVERIAICWWRHKRALRYENSEILFGQGEVAIRGQVSNVRDLMMPKDLALTMLLESAEKEIEAIGEISLELQEKMFATDPLFRERWAQLQAVTKQKHDEVVVQRAQEAGISPAVAKEVINKSPRYASKMALTTTRRALRSIESWAKEQFESVLNVAFDRQAIPNRDALDRLLRYEAAIERDLGRANDRLERLQRRRKGEPVPPPGKIRLSGRK